MSLKFDVGYSEDENLKWRKSMEVGPHEAFVIYSLDVLAACSTLKEVRNRSTAFLKNHAENRPHSAACLERAAVCILSVVWMFCL